MPAVDYRRVKTVSELCREQFQDQPKWEIPVERRTGIDTYSAPYIAVRSKRACPWRHPGLRLLGLALAFFGCIGRSAVAAEPSPQVGGFSFGPQEMFDRIFGPERKEDKLALARIKVPPQEEQRMGRSAVESYLAHLKAHRIAVINRGKDVEYLRDWWRGFAR